MRVCGVDARACVCVYVSECVCVCLNACAQYDLLEVLYAIQHQHTSFGIPGCNERHTHTERVFNGGGGVNKGAEKKQKPLDPWLVARPDPGNPLGIRRRRRPRLVRFFVSMNARAFVNR